MKSTAPCKRNEIHGIARTPALRPDISRYSCNNLRDRRTDTLERAETALALAIEGTITVVVSELALLEVLTDPMKHQNSALIASYEKLFESPQLQVRPIDRIVLRAAAELRASIPALRTPDAIHAATASLENCVRFITNDKGFRRLPQLSVLLLDELISP
jgi:predicted nucleic acid-binding protein